MGNCSMGFAYLQCANGCIVLRAFYENASLKK